MVTLLPNAPPPERVRVGPTNEGGQTRKSRTRFMIYT